MLTTRPPVLPSGSNRFSRSLLFGAVVPRIYFIIKPEGKRPLGRPRRRWEDNIKIDLRKVGCDPEDLMALAEDRD